MGNCFSSNSGTGKKDSTISDSRSIASPNNIFTEQVSLFHFPLVCVVCLEKILLLARVVS